MPPFEPVVVSEAAASLPHGLSYFDPQLLPFDSDDAMVCRATSPNGDGASPQSVEPPSKRQQARKQKVKGKGKVRERKPAVKVKEELMAVSLNNYAPASFVSPFSESFCEPLLRGIELLPSPTGTTALPVALWAGWCIVMDVPRRSIGYVSILRWRQVTLRRVNLDGSARHVYWNG